MRPVLILIILILTENLLVKAQDSHKSICSHVVNTENSPYAKLKSINLTDVTYIDGFWKDRVDMVHEITIPHLYEVMNIEDQGKSVHNLEIAAGLKEGKYKGNDWQDAWLHKWIEMAAISYAVTGDKALDKHMDYIIDLIAKAQQTDGYISTNIIVRGEKRFQNPHRHEWYNMGHLMTAAALHNRITGKTEYFGVAKKVCDYAYDMFKNHNEEMAHFPLNPSMIMGAVEMYRETNDPKHLELAKLVVDQRGKFKGGTDLYQDRVPLKDDNEVVGHAVWYTYLFAGATDVYLESGDKKLFDALDRMWRDLMEHKLYIHGGACALYRGIGIRKDGRVFVADDVHEAVGLPFQQPNALGYNETCGQVGVFMWNYRMLCVTGNPKYAEVMENEMYNGFLGSMGQDGKSFFYVNPLRWHGHDQFLLGNSALERGVPGSENIGTCCPTNYSRSLVELQGMLYSKSENTLWVHHYGANRYDDGDIVFEQKTRYPWEGNVVIEIEKLPANQKFKIRIPEWAEGATISVNGKKVEDVEAGTYATVTNLKKYKNKIEINFPMDARLVAGNPKIEETFNQAAVKRGPILYTLEEIDLPEGVEVDEVVLPVDVKLKPKYEGELLNGVTTLEGEAKYFERQNWDNTMYQDLKKPELKNFKIKLIPYYTWANRGVADMSVWLPLDY